MVRQRMELELVCLCAIAERPAVARPWKRRRLRTPARPPDRKDVRYVTWKRRRLRTPARLVRAEK